MESMPEGMSSCKVTKVSLGLCRIFTGGQSSQYNCFFHNVTSGIAQLMLTFILPAAPAAWTG